MKEGSLLESEKEARRLPMEEQGLLEQIVTRLGSEVEGLWAQVAGGQVGAGEVEWRIQAVLREAGLELGGVLLEAADRRLCQGKPLHDRRTRSVVTLFGRADVTRGRLEGGFYPLDQALGLVENHGWTQAVQEAVSLVCCEKAFEPASDLLKRLLGLSISAPAAQQVAESAGARAWSLSGASLAPPVNAENKTLVIAVDGCQAPQRDGWHEVKVGDLYANEYRVKTASGRGRLVYKEYLATLEDAAGFGRKLWQAACRWKVDRAKRVVIMGDGAPWIWNLAAEHFPGALEIVDFYHAAEHLWSVGEALFGDRSHAAATSSWVRRYLHSLRRGGIDAVIAAIARAQESQNTRLSTETQNVVRRNLEYFKTNRDRMHYDRYQRMHLPIGTGAVEGSCKFLVQQRFKLPGCRWSHHGLAQMLALKQLRLNHHWDQLWKLPYAA
jgi:hypothetical protein